MPTKPGQTNNKPAKFTILELSALKHVCNCPTQIDHKRQLQTCSRMVKLADLLFV